MSVKVYAGRRMTKRARAFFGFLGGEAGGNATEAARLAGYRAASEMGSKLRKTWPEEVEKAEERLREGKRLSDAELEEIPAAIARSATAGDQNRLKALELVARIRGKLSDKLSINVTRADMMKQLDEALATLAQLSKPSSEVADESAPSATDAEEMIRPITGTRPN